MKFTSALGAAVLSLVTLFGAPQAIAATVTFEFDKDTARWTDQLFYSKSGLDLSVTGKTTKGGSAQVATWQDGGLGMCNVFEGFFKCPKFADQHAIDNSTLFGIKLLDDVAVLTFSKAVTLKKMTFNNLGNVNTFDLSLSNGAWVDVLTDEPESGTWVAGRAFTALAFGVSAGNATVTKCNTRRDNSTSCKTGYLPSAFKLTSVEVETAAVPLPAAGLLLIAGLGTLGALRRRKRT